MLTGLLLTSARSTYLIPSVRVEYVGKAWYWETIQTLLYFTVHIVQYLQYLHHTICMRRVHCPKGNRFPTI